MRFQDKVGIITGGGSGMGKEVATRFVAEGGSVVINGRDAVKAEAAAREIDPTGTHIAVYVGDVSLPATGEALVKTALDRFGRLDVLFNNAGIFAPKPFLEVTEAEYDRFLDNAAPTACSARAAFKAPRVGASPQSNEAIVKIDRPQSRMRRRPRRSARAPAAIRRAAKGRIYALTTHSTSVNSPCRLRAMEGSATATIFASSMMRKEVPAAHSSIRAFRPDNQRPGFCGVVIRIPSRNRLRDTIYR